MGWHEELQRRLQAQLHGRREAIPDQLFRDGGTSNYQSMATGAETLRSFRFGTGIERTVAFAHALDLLDRHEREGHLLLEEGAPDPHYGMNAAGAAALRLAALESGHEALLEATRRWWVAHYRYLLAGSAPDGEILLPGTRFEGDPVNTVASAVYRLLAGLPQRFGKQDRVLDLADAAKRWRQEETWYLAPLFLLACWQASDTPSALVGGLEAPPELPALWLPTVVERRERGYTAWLTPRDPVPEGVIFPVSWVQVEYGADSDHRRSWGRDWKSPPPSGDHLGPARERLQSRPAADPPPAARKRKRAKPRRKTAGNGEGKR